VNAGGGSPSLPAGPWSLTEAAMLSTAFILSLLLVSLTPAQELEAEDLPCPAREVCVPTSSCPRWQDTLTSWKLVRQSLSPNSLAYTAKLDQLKSQICNRKERGVCCPPTGPPAPPASSSCSLASPSCLPSLGQCGQRDEASHRVVGGENTRPGEFPFTALLGKKDVRSIKLPGRQVMTFTEPAWVCGGTLVNLWYVVTAGHCQGVGEEALAVVRLGEYQVTGDSRPDCLPGGDTCLPDLQDFQISEQDVTVHPDYQKLIDQVHNDIALIRLPRPAVLNSAVQVVCLPLDAAVAAAELGVGDLRAGLEGRYPQVVGWGHTHPLQWGGDEEETGAPSSVQQRLAVPVLAEDQCNFGFSFSPTDSQICAGAEQGRDSCRGDSGGPLYLKRVSNLTGQVLVRESPWYLIGVVSFGTRVCGNGSPGIYSRVQSFLPWIQETIMLQ